MEQQQRWRREPSGLAGKDETSHLGLQNLYGPEPFSLIFVGKKADNGWTINVQTQYGTRNFKLSKGMPFPNLTHLCIIANKSSVVRDLLGDVMMMSSSTLVSSVKGESELSLGVESAGHNIPKASLGCLVVRQFIFMTNKL